MRLFFFSLSLQNNKKGVQPGINLRGRHDQSDGFIFLNKIMNKKI